MARMHLHTVEPSRITADEELVGRMRASFCVLGPLLARREQAIVPLPGGCRIGPRPVDVHLQGLAALGANIRIENGFVIGRSEIAARREDRILRSARTDRHRHGQRVDGRGAGARRNDSPRRSLRTGDHRSGRISDFAGRAHRRTWAPRHSRILGVDQLGGGDISSDSRSHRNRHAAGRRRDHRRRRDGAALPPGSSRCRAGRTSTMPAARSKPAPIGFAPPHRTGCGRCISPRCRIPACPPICKRSSWPWPRWPTARAPSATVFSRSASRTSPSCAAWAPASNIAAPSRLSKASSNCSGGEVTASDLRASAALVLAGLAADGCTTIRHAHHLHRGYDRLIEKLQSLGANVGHCIRKCRSVSRAIWKQAAGLLWPARNLFRHEEAQVQFGVAQVQTDPTLRASLRPSTGWVCRCGSVFSRWIEARNSFRPCSVETSGSGDVFVGCLLGQFKTRPHAFGENASFRSSRATSRIGNGARRSDRHRPTSTSCTTR